MFKKLLIGAFALLVILAFVFKDLWLPLWHYQSRTDNKELVSFYIKEKLSIDELGQVLVQEKVLNSTQAFEVIAAYKKLDQSKIALGKYDIEPGTSIRNLLNGFTLNSAGNGNAEVEVNVVIPNARFVSDVVERISSSLMIDSAKLSQLLYSKNFLDQHGLTTETLPSLFVPNTYRSFYDVSLDDFVERLVAEYKRFWTPEKLEKLEEIGLHSPAEAVTVASIVYSEQAKLPEEWPVIAGLYLNRVKNHIPLQSDPTFKFCWGKELDTVKRLLAVHRNIDCPYNTYKYPGLPPGPICIPPIQTVEAVLNREDNNYIYMVAQPGYEGRHFFTDKYSEHLREAGKYQRWLSTELKKNQ